jgi:hypothetical protein
MEFSPITPLTDATNTPISMNPEDWKIELVSLGLILVYIVFFTSGMNRNKKIATTWYDATRDFWASQFTHTSPSLMNDSPSHSLLYASGRQSVEKMYAFVEVSSLSLMKSALQDMILYPGSWI